MSDDWASPPPGERGRRVIELKFSPADDAPEYRVTLREDGVSHWVTWQVSGAARRPDDRREASVCSESVQALLARLAEVRIPLCAPPSPCFFGRYAELEVELDGLELRMVWQELSGEWQRVEEFVCHFTRWVEDLVGLPMYYH